MGATSVLKRNKESLAHELEERLINQMNSLYIKDKFMVDCGVKDLEIEHTILMYGITNSCSCETAEYIKNQLTYNFKCKKKKSICDTARKCNHSHEHSEIIKDCCSANQHPTVIEAEW